MKTDEPCSIRDIYCMYVQKVYNCPMIRVSHYHSLFCQSISCFISTSINMKKEVGISCLTSTSVLKQKPISTVHQFSFPIQCIFLSSSIYKVSHTLPLSHPHLIPLTPLVKIMLAWLALPGSSKPFHFPHAPVYLRWLNQC